MQKGYFDREFESSFQWFLKVAFRCTRSQIELFLDVRGENFVIFIFSYDEAMHFPSSRQKT